MLHWEGDYSRRLSEHLDAFHNPVPAPSCRCNGLHAGEYMKDRKRYEKDIAVVGGEILKAH